MEDESGLSDRLCESTIQIRLDKRQDIGARNKRPRLLYPFKESIAAIREKKRAAIESNIASLKLIMGPDPSK
jgi:hypothetical protein